MSTGTSTQAEAGWKYLLLAIGAFIGLALEAVIAYFLEPMVYGRQMSVWSTGQSISHWIITCIIWGFVAFILIRISKSKAGFNIFTKPEKLNVWQWVIVIVFVIFAFIMSWTDWKGFKVLSEFYSNGWLKFIFQYIYYVFETAMFTLIIVFGQKAFEKWTKIRNFPWGGILCAVTWGLGHILSKDSIGTGLLSALLGLMFGTVYLIVNRDIKKAYVILFLMFVL